MNWLAHFALSPMDDGVLMGNWLADLFPGHQLETIADPAIKQGLALHRLIDKTTDQHPRMRAALAEMPPEIRRGGGIILDVFWDHFLSLEFTRRTGHRLEPFVVQVLARLERALPHAPHGTAAVLETMRQENWLGSYTSPDGVELTLNRISHRLSPRAKTTLSPRVARLYLESHTERLRNDFDLLWRDLSASVDRARLPQPPR